MVYFETKCQRIRKRRTELLMALGNGSKHEMELWGKTDAMQFFMDLWVNEERISKILNKNEESNG